MMDQAEEETLKLASNVVLWSTLKPAMCVFIDLQEGTDPEVNILTGVLSQSKHQSF